MRASIVMAAVLVTAACSSSGGSGRELGGDPPEVIAGDVGDGMATTETRETEVTGTPTASDVIASDDEVVSDAAPEAVAVEPWPSACRVVEDGVDTIALPEASGAAHLPDGRIVVVADSGNGGRALVFDPDRPADGVAATLPLGDGAGDDIEGLDRGPDGRLWGLTSAGWLRAWRAGDGAEPAFVLDLGPTPVAPEGDWRCDATGVNCGPNYEGLCLHPAPADGACAGWAASKARGALVCLVAAGPGYEVDPERTISIAPEDQLSGCAYEPEEPHRLVVAGNVLSGSTLWEVDEATGQAIAWTAIGAANQETVIVITGGAVHSFGDLQTLTPDSSPRIVLRCPASTSAVESAR